MRAQLAMVDITTGKMDVLTFHGPDPCGDVVAELYRSRTEDGPEIIPVGVLVWGCEERDRLEIDKALAWWFGVEGFE